MAKTEGQKLEEKLCYKIQNIGMERPEDVEKAMAFCEGYKKFLDHAKIEREAVRETIRMAEENGYQPFERSKKYKTGDKVYFDNRGKSIILTTIGKRPLDEGVHFNIAHIDSPRLDLKPNPLYEKEELAFFKTHYYGGIKKYQWAVTPLALHGRVMLRDGRALDLDLGEKPGDPVFVVSDLLPHLAQEQVKRTLADGIKGEELNVLLDTDR